MLNRIGRIKEPGKVDFIEPGPGKVVIKVIASAICGSDLHIFRGKHPSVKLPVTIGHELSGTVEQAGEGAEHLLHKRVTLEPCVVCGHCEACRSGDYNFCENISFTYRNGDGSMANYVEADADRVFELPDSLSFEEGCLIEPLSVATHAVRRADIKLGESALVIGAGAIGLFVTALLRAAGAGEVTVCDVTANRLAAASGIGASHTINSRECDFDEEVNKITSGKGFDKTFECVGREQTFAQAMNSLKKNGLMTVVGIFEQPNITINAARFVTHEIKIQGAQGYCRDFPVAIAMSDRLDLKKFITHTFPLSQLQTALETASDPGSGSIKVIVKP